MRRSLSLSALLFATCFTAIRAHAQSALLDLPRDSQHAKIMQRVGITDITINYHRPLVKGRKVWGGLVPYGQVWRAGTSPPQTLDRKSTRLNSSHPSSSYAVFCSKKKNKNRIIRDIKKVILHYLEQHVLSR